jgi:hypothetical protein
MHLTIYTYELAQSLGLDSYVTDKIISDLFVMLAEEEKISR